MTKVTRTLWHYTCSHTYAYLGDSGLLVPAQNLVTTLDDYWPAQFVWLTDLRSPIRDALGLTSTFQHCDRTAYRYRVADTSTVFRWADVRRTVPNAELLELADGARPAHWYVSVEPVPAVLSNPQ